MKRKNLICGACVLAVAAAMMIAGRNVNTKAENAINALPAAGASVALGEGESFSGMQERIVAIVLNNSTSNNSQKSPLTAVAASRADITDNNIEKSMISLNAAMSDPVLFTTPEVVVSEPVIEENRVAYLPVSNEDVLMEIAANDIVSVSEEKTTVVCGIPSDVPVVTVDDNSEQDIEEFANLVIADVNNYVNVRAEANTESEIVGKLYDDSVGDLLEETEDGWYKIHSGKVIGYVKAEFCVSGADAVEKAKEVGTRIATVNTTTLKVRKEASTDSPVLGLVPIEEELIVTEETDGWVQVDIEEGYGYVSDEFVELRTDFVHAESKEEEEARLKKEKEEREAARAAAAKATKPKESKNNSGATVTIPSGGSDMGNQVIQYALQFVGNPYVYGGSSLTNGTDCSGFVMSVYSNFGVSLPHSSTSDRSQGYAVDGIENAVPGDIVCYSGHVALYVGNNQIVHASNSKTGIIVSDAGYKKILAVRRIF